MLDKILSMTWEEFMNSDLLLKSNAHKHVIEIKGGEFDKNDKSTILIYCNVYTGSPMIVLMHYKGTDVEQPVFTNSDYAITRTNGVDEDGTEFTEFVLVLRSMQKALED